MHDHKWARYKEQQFLIWISVVMKFKKTHLLLEKEAGSPHTFGISKRLQVIEDQLNAAYKISLGPLENLLSRKESLSNAIRVINRQLAEDHRFTQEQTEGLGVIKSQMQELETFYDNQIKASIKGVGKKGIGQVDENAHAPKPAKQGSADKKYTNQIFFSDDDKKKSDLTRLLVEPKTRHKPPR